MSKLERLLILFAVAFLILLVGPALLGKPFGPYPLIKTGDVLDLLTPFVLIPVYWHLLRIGGQPGISPRTTTAFLLLAAAWIEGQGMHLAANSISHLLKDLAPGPALELTYFYDEVLSHYLWHLGVVGMSGLLAFQAWKAPPQERSPLAPVTLAGILHGFNLFLTFTEGQTTPLGVPFALLLTVAVLVWGRARLKQRPLLLFLFVACGVATLFFAGWGLYWGGLPEFSEVGIID